MSSSRSTLEHNAKGNKSDPARNLLPGDPLQDHALLNNLKTAVLVLNECCQPIYLNNAAESLLEVSHSRLASSDFAEFFSHADTRRAVFKQALAGENPYTERMVTLLLPDNRETTVDYTVTPITEGGKPALLVEMLPMDRSLRIDRERALQAANKTSRNLIRGLAHEIKNPLGGIRGASQLLAQELEREELHEYTDIIISEVDRLRQLVDKLAGPSTPAKLAPLNIHEVTEHVATLVAAEAQGALDIVREYDPSIPELIGDRGKLIQATLNLVRNAMQALESRDASSTTSNDPSKITLRTRIINNFTIGKIPHRVVCRLEVIDNGPGIPEDIGDRIFYPMISGRAEGSGLGLPIAQSAIHLHQGLIECESKPGHTRFSVYLPLQPKPEQFSPKHTDHKHTENSHSKNGHHL